MFCNCIVCTSQGNSLQKLGVPFCMVLNGLTFSVTSKKIDHGFMHQK